MDKYLIINAGSSSLKYSLYNMPSEEEISRGYFEKIGNNDSIWTIKTNNNKLTNQEVVNNHNDAVKIMMRELLNNNIITSINEIKGIGHRILHGGEIYKSSSLITDKVINDIDSLTKMGPLHHPGELAGIKAMLEYLPNTNQVAVFDTSFHQTIPKCNYLYPIKYEWYQKYGVRKYGFHGTSHRYITEEMKKILNNDNVNLIICHVGSGASISCIKNGLCFNTTMGLTPLDGLIMGTRSGSIDPSIIKYMMDETSMNINEIDNALNKESGLKGICGVNDFRDVVKLRQSHNELAILAYDMFLNSIIKYIAEYYFTLEGKVDAIVFTAGVLENNSELRENIVNKISNVMGVKINKEVNDTLDSNIITTLDSNVPIYVIPTNEELMILRDTYKIINK